MNSMPFANYEEFKELFVRKDGQRKNKILLSYIKTGELRKYVKKYWFAERADAILNPKEMASLFYEADAIIRDQSRYSRMQIVSIMGQSYGSDVYKTDGKNGICVDGDISAYRYVNIERDHVYKMKIGKMYKHLILNSEYGQLLPEPVVLWMCEEMTRRWEAWAKSQLPTDDLVLHIDDNFKGIYNGDGRCVGNFGSCMNGGKHASFYSDAVKAHAAYLTNGDGGIVARCVIFDEVHDNDTGEVFRYAERQYSSNGNELLQRVLVQKLIDGGHIDCYKKVGAGCGDKNAIVNVKGESMSEHDLWIECNLEPGDVLSYQDTFKDYDDCAHRADNYGHGSYELDSTDNYFDDDDDDDEDYEDDYHWSEYNQERIPEDEAYYVDTRDDYFYSEQVREALVWGGGDRFYRENCCKDDCVRIGDEWYYAGTDAEDPEDNGLCVCARCGDIFLPKDAKHSDLTGKDYCDDECLQLDEEKWKIDHCD